MPETYISRIRKEDIEQFPLAEYQGNIELVDSYEKLEAALEDCFKTPVLGFDTETRPAFQKGVQYPVSLIQLATENTVYLIRLNMIEITEALSQLLSDENIVKAGVALHQDLQGLNALKPFRPGGFADLSHMARERQIETLGLRSLAAIVLGVRISKRAKLSNWAKPELTEEQIVYAATDAWISREIYLGFIGNPEDPVSVAKETLKS
ncbi:MAG: 3'-5' exonuclease domain-containing protein 2 [SAR324 cluster bacterium]|nr:3'-5' exonuclease domain-containing protein 2 [SAR324 cluster bacterium]